MSYNISIRLDKRRKKDTGMYPVKIRVYGKTNRREKWYNLNIDLTEKDFEEIWLNPTNKNLRGSKKELRLKLQAIENRANDEAKAMDVFDFEKFEFKLFRKSSDKNNVHYHFNLAIDRNNKNDKISTAESFKYTLNSFANFSENVKKCPSWCERLARTHYLIYINFQNGMVIITIISCTAKFPIYWVGHKA